MASNLSPPKFKSIVINFLHKSPPYPNVSSNHITHSAPKKDTLFTNSQRSFDDVSNTGSLALMKWDFGPNMGLQHLYIHALIFDQSKPKTL